MEEKTNESVNFNMTLDAGLFNKIRIKAAEEAPPGKQVSVQEKIRQMLEECLEQSA